MKYEAKESKNLTVQLNEKFKLSLSVPVQGIEEVLISHYM